MAVSLKKMLQWCNPGQCACPNRIARFNSIIQIEIDNKKISKKKIPIQFFDSIIGSNNAAYFIIGHSNVGQGHLYLGKNQTQDTTSICIRQ